MFQILKKNKKKIAGMLSAVLFASSILSHPVPTQAKEDSDFQISAEWVNSPTKDTNGFSSKTKYIWKAETEETRSVTMALEYYFNNSVNSSGFPAESIEIHVPGLADVYRHDPVEASITLPDDWDYDYHESDDEYVIYNIGEIDNLTGFAGEFAISYTMNSRELTTNTTMNIEPYAIIDQETIYSPDDLNFQFSSVKDQYRLQASVKTVGDTFNISGAEDMNVIRYEITESIQSASRGAYDKFYQVQHLGDGVILGYSDGEDISSESISDMGDGYKIPYAPTRQIYIGYPKDKTDKAEHRFYLYGSYYDEDNLLELAHDETSVDIKNFDFTYNGDLYMIGNTGYDTKPDMNRISLQELQNRHTLTYSLSAVAIYSEPENITAFSLRKATASNASKRPVSKATPSNATPSNAYYDDEEEYDEDEIMLLDMDLEYDLDTYASDDEMDVWIIDDFIYVQDGDGNYRVLKDSEYEMKSITIPSHTEFINEDGLALSSGKYKAEILVNTFNRNATAYKTITIDKKSHTVELPEGTNRVMVRICGLKESLYLEHGNMWLDIEYHLDKTGDFLPGGYIRNLDSIWVDWCGNEHHNTVDPTVSYPGDDDDVIKNRDMDSYGVYMQRNYFDYYYISRNIQGLLLVTQETDDSYAPTERNDGFIVTEKGYESYVGFTSVFANVVSGAKKWTTYTILPEGLELNHNESIAVDVAVPSGLSMTTENLKVNEVKNYKNSGRTYVSITYDFPDKLVAEGSGTILASVELPVRVSFKAAAKNTSYPVWGISMMESPKSDVAPTDILESAYPEQAKGGLDDGSAIAAAGSAEAKLWADINRDGSTKEKFVYNNVMLNITDLAAVNMEVISYVRNETSDFIANIDEEHRMTEVKVDPEATYIYRLNAINTGSVAKNVVFYDILENAELDGEKGAWKGNLDYVDTSALSALGLDATVYFCSNENPVLDYTNRMWGILPPTSVDKITAVAVVIDSDKGFVLSDNVFIDLHMKTPSMNMIGERDVNGTHTLNRYTLKYDALSGNKSLNSNITGVTIYEKGEIKIVKKDRDTGSLLSGAKFKLVDAGNTENVIATCTTDELGEATIKNIPFGEYVLIETEAPVDYQMTTAIQYPVYLGANIKKIGMDGQEHDFVKKAELIIYNEALENRTLVITKAVTDSDGADIFGEVSFLYRVEGKDRKGQKQIWNVIITPENGYGSVTIENMPIPDENGYQVTELTSSRYHLISIEGTNLRKDGSERPLINLEGKSAIVDLKNHKTGQVDFVNQITRWDKFSWSSFVINNIKK